MLQSCTVSFVTLREYLIKLCSLGKGVGQRLQLPPEGAAYTLHPLARRDKGKELASRVCQKHRI